MKSINTKIIATIGPTFLEFQSFIAEAEKWNSEHNNIDCQKESL